MTSRESTDSEKVQVPVLGPEKSHDPLEIIKEGRGRSVRYPRSSTKVLGLCLLLQVLITRSLQEARGPACDFLPLHTPSLLSPSRAALVPIFSIGENDIYDHVENSQGSWLWWFQDRLHKSTRGSIHLFYGHGVFQYSSGLMLYHRPITTVGEPRPGLGRGGVTE